MTIKPDNVDFDATTADQCTKAVGITRWIGLAIAAKILRLFEAANGRPATTMTELNAWVADHPEYRR